MTLYPQQHMDIRIVVIKQVLMLDICLLYLNFHYQYYTTYCIFFLWTFYHFTCLPALEIDIVLNKIYEYDKIFSIFAPGKSGGTCDAKVKEKK